MKARLLTTLLLLILTPSLRSQTPMPKADQDCIVVVGEVHTQGLILYTPGMKLMAAIDAAGPSDFAQRLAVILIRGGKKETIKIAHLRGSPSEPVLQPWDIIFLPPSIF